MRTLWQDLRYGIRMLMKNPGFTVVAVLSLALGIGANTTIFSLVDKLLVRSLPVKAPEQLIFLHSESISPKFLNTVLSYPDYVDYRDRNQVFSGLIAFRQANATLDTGDAGERLTVEMASGSYFDVLGVDAARGRTFRPEEDQVPGGHPVAVVSHGLWQRRFGSDPEIIGKIITLNESSYTVIGVARRGFGGTQLERPTDIWVPLMMYSQLMHKPFTVDQRDDGWLKVMGRLKPGVTAAQAEAAMDVLARQIREAYTPQSDLKLPFNERRMILEPGGKGDSFLRKELANPLKLLAAVVGMILFIACANVASLLLARATLRRKEIAVRLALGASRARLVAQLLTESVLLALLGGAAGMLLVPWLNNLLLAFQPRVLIARTALDESIDERVLGFTLLVSVASGIAFGLIPALQSSRPDLVPALKEEGSALGQRESRFSVRNLLVVAQVALSLVVLIGAGLFVRSLRNLLAIDPGYNTENVLLVSIALPEKSYDEERGREFFRQLTERVKSLPGVTAVSGASITPLSGSVINRSVIIEGRENESETDLSIDTNNVGPGYHELMGIPIVQGRGFTEQDRRDAPGVVIINEAMASLYFPGEDSVGKRLRLGEDSPPLEIIGVARDSKFHDLKEAPLPHFDLPLLQRRNSSFMTVHIRTANDAAGLLPAVRLEVKRLDSGLVFSYFGTLEEELSGSLATTRMATTLVSLLGVSSLLLTAIGLYGVIAFVVNQRTREIGIRMALGAQQRDVLKLVVGQGMMLILTGIVIGLAAAIALTRVMASLIYGVSATDPATFIGVALLLAAVALVACYIPARRAAKVDPMVALRYE